MKHLAASRARQRVQCRPQTLPARPPPFYPPAPGPAPPRLTRASLTLEGREPQSWGWQDQGGSLLQRDAGGLQTRPLPPELHPLRVTPLALARASSQLFLSSWLSPISYCILRRNLTAELSSGTSADVFILDEQSCWVRNSGLFLHH